MMAEGLPAELRALAAFLDGDDRPTAVFRRASGQEVIWKVVYENAAVRSCGISLKEAIEALNDGGLLRDDEKRRPGWIVRRVCDGFVAITFDTAYTRPRLDDTAEKLDWIQYPSDNLSKWQRFILYEQDWTQTPLGPIKGWPFELRSVVLSAMADPAPRTIYWGPQNALLYNEAFVPIFETNHPHCLGQPLEQAWRPGMRSVIWPYIKSAYQGKTEKINRLPLHLDRQGFLEETYWDATLTPAIGPCGTVIGVQNVLTECTKAVRGHHDKLGEEDCFCCYAGRAVVFFLGRLAV